jgi:hypothetical protein
VQIVLYPDVHKIMMIIRCMHEEYEELDGPAVSVLGVPSLKLSNVLKGQS